MSPPSVLMRPQDDLETLDFRAFRECVADHLTRGDRLLSLYGTPEPAADAATPLLHAVFLERGKGLTHFRSRRHDAEKYHALTTEFPALHCFEREIHEQYGMRFIDH